MKKKFLCFNLSFPGLWDKVFNRFNLTKVFIIFIVGLFSRVLVNQFFDLNVFLEFSNNISLIYYFLMSLFIVLVHELVGYFQFNIIPSFIIEFFMSVYIYTFKSMLSLFSLPKTFFKYLKLICFRNFSFSFNSMWKNLYLTDSSDPINNDSCLKNKSVNTQTISLMNNLPKNNNGRGTGNKPVELYGRPITYRPYRPINMYGTKYVPYKVEQSLQHKPPVELDGKEVVRHVPRKPSELFLAEDSTKSPIYELSANRSSRNSPKLTSRAGHELDGKPLHELEGKQLNDDSYTDFLKITKYKLNKTNEWVYGKLYANAANRQIFDVNSVNPDIDYSAKKDIVKSNKKEGLFSKTKQTIKTLDSKLYNDKHAERDLKNVENTKRYLNSLKEGKRRLDIEKVRRFKKAYENYK